MPVRVRLLEHARLNLIEREILESEVDLALFQPDVVVPGYGGRKVYMRRYNDEALGTEMLLRVVVEETDAEFVVVTVYKTSQIRRYLGG